MADSTKRGRRDDKRKKDIKRRSDGNRKHAWNYRLETPSSSVQLISYINQNHNNIANRYLIVRGNKVEVNLSQMRFRKITRVNDNFASRYPEIHFLDLSDNVFNSLPDCFQLSTVKSISLQSNSVSELKLSRDMSMLIELNLSWNLLTEFPSAEALKHIRFIKKLFLNNNKIREIPIESISVLKGTNIEVLNLAFNQIDSLPVEIGQLTSLLSFNLSDNRISELPGSILLLRNLLHNSQSFKIYRNGLIFPPQEIADSNGMISIMKHFKASGYVGDEDLSGHRSAKPSDTVLSSHLRMVVVGNEGAGKSTLIGQLSHVRLRASDILNQRSSLDIEEDAGVTQSSNHVPNRLVLHHDVRAALNTLLSQRTGLREAQQIPFPSPITVNICDFGGQEVYHAASEMFFSDSSLHVVVFDLFATCSGYDCDSLVQYWVDLIQARAPGSTIVLVATHVDEVAKLGPSAVRDRIAMVQARLAGNETLRVEDLHREIKVSKDDLNHLAALKQLLVKRPVLYPTILPYASNDADCASLKLLLAHLSHMASPTVEVPNPLRLVNVPLPMRYQSVRLMMKEMRDRGTHFCTIQALDRVVNEFDTYMAPEKARAAVATSTLEITQNAVVYWASVGEVVWFPDKDEQDDGEVQDLNASFLSDAGNTSTDNLLAQAAENAQRNRLDSESAAELGDTWECDGVTYQTYDTQLVDEDDGVDDDNDGGDEGEGSEYSDDNSDNNDGAADGGDQHSEEGMRESDVDNSTLITNSVSEVMGEEGEAVDLTNLRLGAFVFLSPSWLNKAIKGVMNREEMEKVEQDRKHGSKVAPKPSSPVQGLPGRMDSETMPSDFTNGVVKWSQVRRFLLKNAEFSKGSQDFVSRDKNVSEKNRRALTLALLKEVLTRLTLIIPIENTSQSTDNATSESAPESPVRLRPPSALSNDPGDAVSMSHLSSSQASERSSSHRRAGSNTSVVSDSDAADQYGDDEDENACYLLPALMAESNLAGAQDAEMAGSFGATVSFAQKGWIRLERRFAFSRFVPSAIVPRIIARMYARFGKVLKTSAANALGEGSTCWRSAFIQEYGECRVWILFEEGPAGNVPLLRTPNTLGKQFLSPPPNTFGSPRSRLASKDYSSADYEAEIARIEDMGIGFELAGAAFESSEGEFGLLDPITESGKTTSFTFDIDDIGLGDAVAATPQPLAGESGKVSAFTAEDEDGSSGRVVLLRIVSYAPLLEVNAAVDALDDYNSAVREILGEYKGVGEVFPATLCPVCLMKQLPAEMCGQFHHLDRTAVAQSLQDLCAQPRESSTDLVAEYKKWEKRWMDRLETINPGHTCRIKPELLVHVPERLAKLISREDHHSALVQYLRDDVINRSVEGEQQMTPFPLERVDGAAVQVRAVYADQVQTEALLAFYRGHIGAAAVPEIAAGVNRTGTATGTLVTLSTGGAGGEGARPVNCVLTAFMQKDDDHRSNTALFFLVGVRKGGWRYLAKYVPQPVLNDRTRTPHSDAALLELIAPVEVLALSGDAGGGVTFRVRRSYEIKHSADDSSRVDSWPLAQDLVPLPLQLPGICRVPRPSLAAEWTPRAKRSYLNVEQLVQLWGYNMSAPDSLASNWARVVHRLGEHYLVNVYSEQYLKGGPVFDSAGRIVGVVSAMRYRKGTHAAFYVASLNHIEWY